MKTIAFFDAKAYDKESFSRFANDEINISSKKMSIITIKIPVAE